MRRAAKVDANHADVVQLFRDLGCSVLSLAALGKGAPDLLVGAAGRDRLVEVKDGSKAPSRRRLLPEQELFRQTWTGHPVRVVESEADVEALVAEMRSAGR